MTTDLRLAKALFSQAAAGSMTAYAAQNATGDSHGYAVHGVRTDMQYMWCARGAPYQACDVAHVAPVAPMVAPVREREHLRHRRSEPLGLLHFGWRQFVGNLFDLGSGDHVLLSAAHGTGDRRDYTRTSTHRSHVLSAALPCFVQQIDLPLEHVASNGCCGRPRPVLPPWHMRLVLLFELSVPVLLCCALSRTAPASDPRLPHANRAPGTVQAARGGGAQCQVSITRATLLDNAKFAACGVLMP